MPSFTPRWLFHELRRRRMLHTVALYIVGAWVALQVAELALPALDLPEQAIRYVWLAAFLLFPLVLIFAWRYDISSGRIMRTLAVDTAEDADRSLHLADRWVICTLATVSLSVLAFMGVRIAQVEPEADFLLAPEEKSIAVLPITVCEGQAGQAEVAAGLTGEVISRLAERDRIRVIGRVSSFEIGELNLPLPHAGTLLDVGHLLAGELCLDGADLTLHAELRDAVGIIVWRERFRQVVNRFDQVEQRLSTQVANGVAAELGDLLPASPDAPVNPQALQELLRGRAHRWRGEDEAARAAFERALQIQPEYADVVFELVGLERLAGPGYRQEDEFERARPLIDRAMAMARSQLQQDPQSARAHYILGRIISTSVRIAHGLAWQDPGSVALQDPDASLAESEHHLRSAITLDPSKSAAYRSLASVLPRTRTAERLEVLQRGVAVEPFDASLLIDLAQALLDLGRYREAMEQLQRFREPIEVPPEIWHFRISEQGWHGYNEDLLNTTIDMLRSHSPGSLTATQLGFDTAAVAAVLAGLGLSEEAEGWWSRAQGGSPKVDRIEHMLRSWYLRAAGRVAVDDTEQLANLDGMTDEEIVQGSALFLAHATTFLVNAGQAQRAVRLLEKARAARYPDEHQRWQASIWLAYLYQRNGRPDDALPILEEIARELEKLTAVGIRERSILRFLAETYAIQGRDEKALEGLARALDYHAYASFWGAGEPWFRPFARLEAYPKYQALRKRVEIDLDRQAGSIRAILAGIDLEELLSPVMASPEGPAGSSVPGGLLRGAPPSPETGPIAPTSTGPERYLYCRDAAF